MVAQPAKPNATIRGWLTVSDTDIKAPSEGRLASCSSYCSLGMRWKEVRLAAGLRFQIYCNSENDSFRKKIPVDFYETFLYVLETELTEVERNVFLAHYRDLKSVDTMVSELGLTRMQTTEYIGTTLHKLRKEPINSMLLLGIKGKINSLLRVESERGYFDGFDAGVNNREQSNVAGSAESVEKSLTVSIERIPIEELQLSMRARHCLQRAGIVTIGDLMQYSDKELLEIRYLGYTILNEIRDKQREHYSKLRTDVEISLMGDTVDDPA